MIDQRNLVIIQRVSPTDFVESARKLFRIIEKAAKGSVKPKMPLLGWQTLGRLPTVKPSMRNFVDNYSL